MTDIQDADRAVPALRAASTTPPERITAVAVALLVIGFSTWVLLTLSIQAAVILTVASVVAYVAWMKTTYAYPVRTRRVIAVYLCAVAFQFIHMSEEYVGGFPHELTELFNSAREWSEKSFLLTLAIRDGSGAGPPEARCIPTRLTHHRLSPGYPDGVRGEVGPDAATGGGDGVSTGCSRG